MQHSWHPKWSYIGDAEFILFNFHPVYNHCHFYIHDRKAVDYSEETFPTE